MFYSILSVFIYLESYLKSENTPEETSRLLSFKHFMTIGIKHSFTFSGAKQGKILTKFLAN